MSDLEYKDFDAELELKGEDSGQFSAYFARFGNVDRVNELIEPGAFKNLNEFQSDGWIGVSHDTKNLPVAMIDSAKQDDRGLLITGRFHSHPAAQACRSMVKERMASGKSVKCSIGYKTDESKPDKLNGKSIKRLQSLRVFEGSFVWLPANPAASVLSAKSLEPEPDESKLIAVNELKHWLDEQFKAGRIISSATHKKLSGHIDASIKELTDAKAFLDQHNPNDPEPADDLEDGPLVGGGGRVVGKAALLNSLRLRALRSRMKVASLHRG